MAEINTLSEKDCNELDLKKLVQKTSIVLEGYGGFKTKPIGEIDEYLN